MRLLLCSRFPLPCTVALCSMVVWALSGISQTFAQSAPRVIIPSATRSNVPSRQVAPAGRTLYPWKLHINSTTFWVGEQPTQNNPVPNHISSWDLQWARNFGGYDDPDPNRRIASHSTGEFRPKNFVPKLNPFYIALPYNVQRPAVSYHGSIAPPTAKINQH